MTRLLRGFRQIGRREWQKESGYRQQARVENSFFRYKSVLGGGLKARHKGEKLRSGVTSSTGWPSWVGRNPALWCPEREVGKTPPLAPQLNHATAPICLARTAPKSNRGTCHKYISVVRYDACRPRTPQDEARKRSGEENEGRPPRVFNTRYDQFPAGHLRDAWK